MHPIKNWRFFNSCAVKKLLKQVVDSYVKKLSENKQTKHWSGWIPDK